MMLSRSTWRRHVGNGAVLALATVLMLAVGCKRRSSSAETQEKQPSPQQPPPKREPPRLSSLGLHDTSGAPINRLVPAFDPKTTSYSVEVGVGLQELLVKGTPAAGGASMTVNGLPMVAETTSRPIALNLGRTQISIAVAAPGGTTTYMLNVERGRSMLRRASIEAPTSARKKAFGRSIALWGDTLAVGAPDDDATGTNKPGAVYVFRREAGKWRQEARLKASNSDEGDEFGSSIALWGDTLAVGAPGEDSATSSKPTDNSAEESGAVYVFARNRGRWSQQAYLKAPTPDIGVATKTKPAAEGDQFGASVALWGDRLVVGAPGTDTFHELPPDDPYDENEKLKYKKVEGSGAAHVFERKVNKWSLVADLQGNECESHAFGSSVAIWGKTVAVSAEGDDTDRTGVADDHPATGPDVSSPESNPDYPDAPILIPCPDRQTYEIQTYGRLLRAAGSGAVYVFQIGGLGQEAYLKASNTGEGDGFGHSIALVGDMLVVGAPGEDSAGKKQEDDSSNDSGAVYVFARNAGSWTQRAYLKASKVTDDEGFGANLALWGDTLAVGGPPERQGNVHFFARKRRRWRSRIRLGSSSAKADADFGAPIALWGDTLAIAGTGKAANGAVYVFR